MNNLDILSKQIQDKLNSVYLFNTDLFKLIEELRQEHGNNLEDVYPALLEKLEAKEAQERKEFKALLDELEKMEKV